MNRISINALFLLLTHGLELTAAVYVNARLAREWGSAAFGDVGFYLGLTAILGFLFDLGMGRLLIRRLAREKDQVRSLLKHAAILAGPLSLGGSIAFVITGLILAPGSRLDLLLLCCLVMLFTAAGGLFRAVFHSRERMGMETVCTFTERAAWIGAGLWLAMGEASTPALIAWLAISKGLNVAIGAFLYWRYVHPTAGPAEAFDSKKALALAKEALPFGLNTAFTAIYISADVVLLAWLAGPDQAGHYRAASSLVGPLAFLAIAFNDALFPRMSAAAKTATQDAAGYVKMSLRLALLTSLPLCLFFALFAPGVVEFLYGPKYGPTVLLLQVLSLVIPLRFINNSLATGLTACDRQGWRMACAGWAAALNLALNLAILPFLGALGACLTTLATDLVMDFALAHGLRKPIGRLGWQLGLAGASLLLAAVILVPLLTMKVHAIPAALAMALLYPVGAVLAGVIAPTDLKLLWERKK